jgi:hypothetical protein
MVYNERVCCSICGAWLPEEQTALVGYDAVCWRCIEAYYCTCSVCGELIKVTEVDDLGRCWGCSEDNLPPRLPRWHEL